MPVQPSFCTEITDNGFAVIHSSFSDLFHLTGSRVSFFPALLTFGPY